jgi:hypothetical protein
MEPCQGMPTSTQEGIRQKCGEALTCLMNLDCHSPLARGHNGASLPEWAEGVRLKSRLRKGFPATINWSFQSQ